MDPGGRIHARLAIILLLGIILARTSNAGLAITYCSSENTSGDSSPDRQQWQSTGLCGDHCQGSFAFAIIQGHDCWCSNYAPADQQDTLNCNEPCPGIGTEWCGSESAGLYGYFQLPAGKPLGTSGNAASQPSSTAFSSQPSSSTSSPASSSPSPSPSPTEVYTSVTTVTGQVRTVLVTPTATADATLGQSSTRGSSGVSAGKVAGIVVGVVLGLALLVGAAIWLWLRRRRDNNSNHSPEGSFTAERMGGSSNTSNGIPSRQVSQLSSAELLGKAPRIQTNFFPSDNDPRSAGTTSSNNLDRRSLTTDQRLNPWALYSQDDRMSSVSLQDNQDYSRQLRIANPD